MFKDLDNIELSMVYYQFKEHLDRVDKELITKFRCESMDVTLGNMEVRPFAILPITDEEVAAIRSSHYYQTLHAIVDKLHPVVMLIEEAEPNIKTKLNEQ